VVALLLGCILASYGGLSIDAPDTVRTAESFQVRIRAEGESVSGLDLDPPSARGLSFRGSSSSTSVRTSVVNGRRTTVRRAELALGYVAFQSGTVSLGPFVVHTGAGESHNLGSVAIVVLPDSTGSGGEEGRRQLPGSSRSIWLEAVPEMPRRLYAGMPLRVRYILHTRYPLRRITRSWDSPEHAVVRLAEDPGDPRWQPEDALFSRAEILTLEMVPACPGSVLVPFVEVNAVAFARGSPMGSGVRLKSDSVRVPVHPIPMENRPENFGGVVGEVHLRLEVGECPHGSSERPVALTAEGDGASFLEDFPGVTVRGPAGLESVGRNGGEKTRTWTWLLTPTDSGRVILGPDSLAWLDPVNGTFHQASFGPERVDVLPPSATEGAVMPENGNSGGPSATTMAAALVVLAALTAMLLAVLCRRRETRISIGEASDPDELLSALETSLSRLLTGEEGYVEGRELARMLTLRGVDRITVRCVVACWRHAEALVSGSERYMLGDVRKEAEAVIERLEGLLAGQAGNADAGGEG